MTDAPNADAGDATIAEKTDRLETIIEQLEDGEVSLERADELHEEGRQLLASLEDDLDLEDGSVTVRD